MRRHAPQDEPDPGWERCSWDEALDLVAATLLEVRASSGAHTVAFNKGTTGARRSPTPSAGCSGSSITSAPRTSAHDPLCQWPRDTAGAQYTFGTPALRCRRGAERLHRGVGLESERQLLDAGHGHRGGQARGARLLVVDPRRVGLANKADVWLQVRPGTDGALALGLIHLLIRDGGYDIEFVREWTNAPFLCGTTPVCFSQAPTWTACPLPVDVTSRPSRGAPSSSSTTPSGASMRWTRCWP